MEHLYELYAMLTKSDRKTMGVNIRHELHDTTDSNYPHFETTSGKYFRTAYHTTSINRVWGARRIGAEVRIRGKNAVIVDIQGQTVKYKTLDKFGLDNFAYVKTNKMMSEMGIADEREIMMPEQDALDWLYMTQAYLAN